jgi:chromosome partitioning protein
VRNFISSGIRRFMQPEAAPQATYPRGDRDAQIIAVATIKGGVGKTTSAVHLADGLARFGDRRVLLVDLDAQGHCRRSLAERIQPAPTGLRGLSEILLADGGSSDQLLDAVVPTALPGLDLVPADPELTEAEGRIAQKIGKELLLRDALSITRTHYDTIVLDCPPNEGNLTLNALLAADSVLVPTDLSPLAVDGADTLLSMVMTIHRRLGHRLDVLGILLTRVDGRNRTTNDALLDEIREAWDELLLDTQIGINNQLVRAQLAGETVYDFAPNSRGAEHYERLTTEVLARLARDPDGAH